VEQHIVPRSLGKDDYLIEFGYVHLTGRNLGLAAVALGLCVTALRNAHLAMPMKIGEIVLTLAIFGSFAFLKPQRRSLIDWGQRVYEHARKPRVFSYQSLAAVVVRDDDEDIDDDTLAQSPSLTRIGMGLRGTDLEAETPRGNKGRGRGKKGPKASKEKKPPKEETPPVQATTRTARSTQELPYIPRSFSGGVGILPDGSAFAEVGVVGIPLGVMDGDERRGVEGRLHHFLNTLSFPIEFVVEAKATNTAPHVNAVKKNFRETPDEENGFKMDRIKALSWADAEWYEGACAHYGVLDFDLYVVIPASPGSFSQAAGTLSPTQMRELNEHCYAVISGLTSMGASARRLDNKEMIMDWRDALEPSKAARQPISAMHLSRALAGAISLGEEVNHDALPRVTITPQALASTLVAAPTPVAIAAPASAVTPTNTAFFTAGGSDESVS